MPGEGMIGDSPVGDRKAGFISLIIPLILSDSPTGLQYYRFGFPLFETRGGILGHPLVSDKFRCLPVLAPWEGVRGSLSGIDLQFDNLPVNP